jgi:uncharacterized protein (TIGR03083 family)
MAEGAKEGIAALRRLHDELVDYSSGLDEAALRTQSGCSEWTVADVLSHLGSAAEIGLRTVTQGQADMTAAPAVWDRWNAMTPEEKASNFVTSGERLLEALEALDDEDLATKKVDLGFLPQPVGIEFLVGMRLGEVGLHRWDVEVAFDPKATLADYVVPFSLARLPMFAGFFAKPIGKTGKVQVEITEPTRTYFLELTADGAQLSEGQAADAPSRLYGPAEAFVRLTSGRLKPEHTPEGVKAEGEVSLDDLRRVFPGY